MGLLRALLVGALLGLWVPAAAAAPVIGRDAFERPAGLAVTAAGDLLVADLAAHRIWRVRPTGAVIPFAGTGVGGDSGDGGGALDATLRQPTAVMATGGGDVIVADSGNNRLRRVAANGSIHPFAGSGRRGFAGDGGDALQARLDVGFPYGLTTTPGGTVVFGDMGNERVRAVSPSGAITTIAGDGERDPADGPAAPARFYNPIAAHWHAGELLISDYGNNRVRAISADGHVRTIAGAAPQGAFPGRCCSGGDGGPATAAGLHGPTALATDREGNLLIADSQNGAVRLVDRAGVIRTLASGYRDGAGPVGLAAVEGGVFVSAGSRLHFIRTGRPSWLFVSVERARRLRGRRLRLTVSASRAAVASIAHGGRVVRRRVRLSAGRTRLTVQLPRGATTGTVRVRARVGARRAEATAALR